MKKMRPAAVHMFLAILTRKRPGFDGSPFELQVFLNIFRVMTDHHQSRSLL